MNNKLKTILSKPIENEYQIVYIMVEIRKKLESLNISKYSLLQFYCHWVLHIEINRISPARKILERIAKEYENKKFNDTILEFIGLRELRKQIGLFLKHFKLPDQLFKDEKNWKVFKSHLINALIGCPIRVKSEPIKYFAFKKPLVGKDDVDWEIRFPDGKVFHGSLTELNPNKISKDSE